MRSMKNECTRRLDPSRSLWKENNGVTSVLRNASPQRRKGELRHAQAYPLSCAIEFGSGHYQVEKGPAWTCHNGSMSTEDRFLASLLLGGSVGGRDGDRSGSYLRPLHYRPFDDKWTATVTLDGLNRLPGVTHVLLFIGGKPCQRKSGRSRRA